MGSSSRSGVHGDIGSTVRLSGVRNLLISSRSTYSGILTYRIFAPILSWWPK